ncbi:MAG TPA: efflux RND transporter permease subunit [Thermoguttaceae bacterium]|nr:efflux RND transporter permease subunit [Thermoguttaceae bacterium]
MRSIIQWSIRNTPAMNTVLVGIVAVGLLSLYLMRREVSPEFELDYITITVPYPGASPEEVEEGICQKIEEAVRARDGIKEIMSIAREGFGVVLLELRSNVPNVQKLLNEVRSDVDRIPSFPEMAEEPEVEQILLRRPAIRVGVIGPESDDPEAEFRLREVAERVREELLLLPSVSQVEMVGAKDYQIDVEISEETLRKYGLTLDQVARILRRENIEIPGGNMKTDSQEILLRGKNKRLLGHEIAKIPLVTQPDGVVLTVGDLGVVRDDFVDTTAIHRINGRPGMVIAVQKTGTEDLLQIVAEVKRFLQDVERPGGYELPSGYSLTTWEDNSIMVHDRIRVLMRNGLQGLIVILVMLTIFLELRLAFWVAAGIAVSVFGCLAVMFAVGQTLNMISLFAFLIVLGMLDDDAVVIGENVHTYRERGMSAVEATVEGTYEVVGSVIASVMTAVIAFMPLFFVPGIMGKFIGVIPVAVVTMLVISLVEVIFLFPCHLAHEPGQYSRFHQLRERIGRTGFIVPWSLGVLVIWGVAAAVAWRQSPPRPILLVAATAVLAIGLLPHVIYWTKPLGRLCGWIHQQVFHRLNVASGRAVDVVINRVYLPMLRWSLDNPSITLSGAVTFLLLCIGMYKMDIVKFTYFPKEDGNTISATIVYPDGTPASVTEAATVRLEEAIRKIDAKYGKPDRPLVTTIHRSVGQPSTLGRIGPTGVAEGSHLGAVGVELVESQHRNIRSIEIVDEWRKLAGEFPGVESLKYETAQVGPGGAPIEFRLLARPRDMAKLEAAVEECKKKLAEYPVVRDIADDSQPGKWEFQVNVKDDAKSLGITAADLAETIRAAYYGEEVMRLQRGRHEVKLMVRYPRDQRRSLADFDNIRVRMQPSITSIMGRIAQGTAAPGGVSAVRAAERPLTELADVRVQRGYSSINRVNQLRSITVTADLDEKAGNARGIVEGMKATFFPGLLARYPELRLNWEGQQQDTAESVQGLGIGLALALVAMFVLLTLEFRSYFQPIMVLAIIPFGIVGAVLGHLAIGRNLTMLSLFGLVALSGVVINNAIVLIDFMNARVRSELPLKEALLDAGRRRFRPVVLTSMTTWGGLLPILSDQSFQAQILAPMATSLAFGLMFSTVVVLFLGPTMYLVYARITMGDTRGTVTSTGTSGAGTMGFTGSDPVAAPGESAAAESRAPLETALPDPKDTVSLVVRDDADDPDENGKDHSERTWPPTSRLPRAGGGQE